MITNDGKQIIAKYLLGQAPAFATHIAAGCGPRPLETDDPDSTPPTKKSLDFEVFRVPIISKGFIRENDQEKIVFKAEMPTSDRYLISEVGFYPAGSNLIAGKYDSKLLITFAPNESWAYVSNGSPSALILESDPLDNNNDESNIDSAASAQFIYSDANIFNNTFRKNRQEPPRFLNRAVLVTGESTYLNSEFAISASSNYLENANINFDLSRNSTSDLLKIAFSLISKTYNDNNNPTKVRMSIHFINNISNIEEESPKAILNLEVDETEFDVEGGGVNRYKVVEKPISDLNKDPNFSFANINYVKIFVSVLEGENLSSDYYVCLDGIKIDNISTNNPLYSLIGYNKIISDSAYPILKQENTNNYIEYRFGIGVDG
jgi:hypothetical protein